MVFGATLSVLTRNVAKEYSESKSIAYAVSLFHIFNLFREKNVILNNERYITIFF